MDLLAKTSLYEHSILVERSSLLHAYHHRAAQHDGVFRRADPPSHRDRRAGGQLPIGQCLQRSDDPKRTGWTANRIAAIPLGGDEARLFLLRPQADVADNDERTSA